MSNRIANIVIYYANEDEVVNYAKELEKQTEDVKLIIIVNEIGKKGIQYLERNLELLTIEYEIYNPGKNLGYLNGLLWGYKKVKEECKWYVLSNTDICIEDKHFFEIFMKSKPSNDECIWIVGPSVYAPKQGKYSNPYFKDRPSRKFYTSRIVAMRFSTLFDLVYRIKNKNLKSTNNNMKKQDSGAIYAVHGSFMFLRKELLDILISRPDWELLYDEEQYIAEVVRQNKHLVYYNSDIEVLHMEGSSTGKVNAKSRYQLMIKANKRLLKEFYLVEE